MNNDYLQDIASHLQTGIAREHTYRAAFEKLIKSILPIRVINEPSRSQHGNPDFVFLDEKNNDLILGYAETKDINVDLDKIENSEQLKRYLGYSHLILTNYLEFRFFRNGIKYQTIKIASLDNGRIVSHDSYFPLLQSEIKAFLQTKPETITNAKRLAQIMGGKAFRIRENVKEFLSQDVNDKNQQILKMFDVMKSLLVHDLTHSQFADMYAQTLVYGLFVARYFDETPENFTREEARDLVPASNPFLRDFFDHIAGIRFEKRLAYIVDELCDVFSVTDVSWIVHQHFNLFGEDESKDPIIHFYEDFLKEYDPAQRKSMGAYYTPIPVVNFMVRSVDYLLKKEFGLIQGLADTSLITRQVIVTGRKEKETLHKVQVLDPAVGTATFLNQIIKFIYNNNFEGQDGRWPSYVSEHLLPRLYGFELMMAPYTIAHLKLGMTLRELGYKEFQRRLGVYLTNSLEEGIKAQTDLFEGLGLMESITKEGRAASDIKQNKPIMVVIGNPPYSVSSSNKGEWIQNLIKDYKKDLNEKKINLDDDYIKFIRFAEHFIEKNESGIVAMITNNSFIDGITHRKMRKHLLETFDDIYILDLHGNSLKKEKSPDGSVDENVFDIQQGVSINIFIRKNEKKKNLSNLYYFELFGKRKGKFNYLNEKGLSETDWKKLNYALPYYFFTPKDFTLEEEYNKGFSIEQIFNINTSGIETQKDSLIIQFKEEDIEKVGGDIASGNNEYIQSKYKIKDSRDWNLTAAREDLKNAKKIPALYRPFDIRWTFYSGKTKGIMAYPRAEVMDHIAFMDNLALAVTQKNRQISTAYEFITNLITDRHLLDTAGDSMQVFPLYTYKEGSRISNLSSEIIKEIEKIVGKVSPEDVLDYIYGFLHSNQYRDRYKEFLKIDFPRIPYPKDVQNFKQLVTLGNELRSLHLFESPKLNKLITTYPVDGSNMVEKLIYEGGKVYINGKQYFGNVPEVAWNFYIGGYQPAQKWLKDRKGRILTDSDLEHYQKIIVALVETDRIMKEIDHVIQF